MPPRCKIRTVALIRPGRLPIVHIWPDPLVGSPRLVAELCLAPLVREEPHRSRPGSSALVASAPAVSVRVSCRGVCWNVKSCFWWRINRVDLCLPLGFLVDRHDLISGVDKADVDLSLRWSGATLPASRDSFGTCKPFHEKLALCVAV